MVFNSRFSLADSRWKGFCRVFIKGEIHSAFKLCWMWENVTLSTWMKLCVHIFHEYCVRAKVWKAFSLALSLTFYLVYCVSDVNTSLSSAVTLISSLLSSLLPFLASLSFSLCVYLQTASLLSFILKTLVSLFPIYSSFLGYVWNGILLAFCIKYIVY